MVVRVKAAVRMEMLKRGGVSLFSRHEFIPYAAETALESTVNIGEPYT